jgi:hypothetical protein
LNTDVGIVLAVHVLLGLVLASWSTFIASPFRNSPQLAAVIATFLAIVLAILGLVLDTSATVSLFVFSIVFPPAFYIFVLKAICGYENNQMPTNVIRGDPDNGIVVLPLIIAALVCGLYVEIQSW